MSFQFFEKTRFGAPSASSVAETESYPQKVCLFQKKEQPRLSMTVTLQKWAHLTPFFWNDPIFEGSWREAERTRQTEQAQKRASTNTSPTRHTWLFFEKENQQTHEPQKQSSSPRRFSAFGEDGKPSFRKLRNGATELPEEDDRLHDSAPWSRRRKALVKDFPF